MKKFARGMLKAAIGAVAARPRLHRVLRRFIRVIPGLQLVLRRGVARAQPKAAPVRVEVGGIVTLEGLCHLSRQI